VTSEPNVSVIFDITHSTLYRYARPVALREHRVLFRPRSSHDMRVLGTHLEILPAPQQVRLIQDAYSNSVALVQPMSPADTLHVTCSFTVEHAGSSAGDGRPPGQALPYPFGYGSEDLIALAHYLQPWYDDPGEALFSWAAAIAQAAGGDARAVLLAMNAAIFGQLLYQPRDMEGVQTPCATLQAGTGTCRDYATLMLEAVRRLGFAARFVSGYAYAPDRDVAGSVDMPGGATHAWVEVYLPDEGWLSFDPTNNLVGGQHLIRVGVARHASLASPIQGAWDGMAGDYLGMQVDVQVHMRTAP
jgi:transglutaminase-like putative cysteine protease